MWWLLLSNHEILYCISSPSRQGQHALCDTYFTAVVGKGVEIPSLVSYTSVKGK